MERSIRASRQNALQKLEKFRTDFAKNGDEALHFNEDQIERLRTLVKNAEIERWLTNAVWQSVPENQNLVPVVLQTALNTGLPLTLD